MAVAIAAAAVVPAVVIANAIAPAAVIKEVSGSMKTVADEKGIGYVILESLKAGATILGSVFLEAMKASLSIWQTIGTIIGSAIYGFMLTTDMPFAKGAQKNAAITGLSTMPDNDIARLAEQMGIKDASGRTPTNPNLSRNLLAREAQGSRESASEILEATGLTQAADLLTNQFKNTKAVFKESSDEIKATVTASMGTFADAMDMDIDPATTYKTTLDNNLGKTFEPKVDAEKAVQAMTKQITLAERLTGQWDAFDSSIKKAFVTLDEKSGDIDGGKMVEAFGSWMTSAADITGEVADLVKGTMDGLVENTRQALFESGADWRAFGQAVAVELQSIVTEMLVVQSIELLKNAGKSMIGMADTAVETGVEAGAEVAKNTATTAAITAGGTAAAGAMALAITTAGTTAAAAMATAISTAGATSSAGGILAAQFGATSTGSMTPYLVGEQRAEMVIPPMGSRIVPNPSVNEGGGQSEGSMRMMVYTDNSMTEKFLRSAEGEKLLARAYRRNKESVRG